MSRTDWRSAELPDRAFRGVGDLDAELVAGRTQARKERDWARADQIRAQLDELGAQVTDTPEGPVWQLR